MQGMDDEDTDEVGESGNYDLMEDSDEFVVELDSRLHGHPMLQSVRCSAHTLQLAVIDAMMDGHSKSQVHRKKKKSNAKCRCCAKENGSQKIYHRLHNMMAFNP